MHTFDPRHHQQRPKDERRNFLDPGPPGSANRSTPGRSPGHRVAGCRPSRPSSPPALRRNLHPVPRRRIDDASGRCVHPRIDCARSSRRYLSYRTESAKQIIQESCQSRRFRDDLARANASVSRMPQSFVADASNAPRLPDCPGSVPTGHRIGTAPTVTSTYMPSGSSALPMKAPEIGMAWDASRATPTRMRLAPATRPLVGSYSTHPAPGT